MRTLPTRGFALLISLLLVAAACGQKPNVAQVAAGGSVIDPNTGEVIDPETGQVLDPGTGDVIGGDTGGSTGGSTGADGATTGSSGGTTGGATGGATGGSGGPGDRTGITDSEIRIGIHAPVTGAAPIAQNSFEEGKDIFWNSPQGKVFGKQVKVFFHDDKFDPATAVQECKKMVEQEKVFLIIGGGGADQITACAKYAQAQGVPYLSAGVNEDGIAGLRSYFALSTTYSQQSPMLAQLVKKQFGGKTVGIAVADSGSFNDAYASIKKALQDANLTCTHKGVAKTGAACIVYDKRIPKSGNANDGRNIANAMAETEAEVVYFLSSPTIFLYTAGGLPVTYNPQFIGPGITSGLATVATIGCQGRAGVDKAIFLSPFPQLDVIDRVDPGYHQAYQAQKNKKGDDLGLALWGLSKQLKTMFDAAGKDMTRQSFVSTLEQGQSFAGGVYPPVKYSPRSHFGGSQVWALQADCGSSTFKTITPAPVGGF